MKKYEYNGVNLIADDSTLKAFCTSLYGMMPTDYEGEDRKLFIMNSVYKFLEEELPQTSIDYEELLRRYIDELGDLIYRLWDHDCFMSTPDFLGEGAKRFFNDIVYDYINVHFKELAREGLDADNYTLPRNQMTEEQEKAFVNDSFALYEAEGFSEKFWSSDEKLMRYNGMPFEVVGRTPLMDGRNKGVDLHSLPMWDIALENGVGISAYPSEIIPSVMKENGCPLFRDESDTSPLPASPNSYLEAKEEMKCYIIRFAKENNWDYENVPEQIRAFFTTWCFLFHVDADTRECDDTLRQIHWLAEMEDQISYEDFESYMVKLIV